MDGLSVSVVKDGEVRTKFALDDTSVTINTGVIAFQSDSISIDSQNFQLETNGNVTATGIFRSNNGVSGAGRNESILSSGGLQLYRTLNNGQNTIAASLSSDGPKCVDGAFCPVRFDRRPNAYRGCGLCRDAFRAPEWQRARHDHDVSHKRR